MVPDLNKIIYIIQIYNFISEYINNELQLWPNYNEWYSFV